MENSTRESDVPPWITIPMAAWQARLWLAQNKLEVVSQWVEEHGLKVDGELQFSREIEYVVLARILIAKSQWNEATRLLQRLLEPAEMGEHTSRIIEILILQALSLQAQGDTNHAITILERALTLAEPGGFIRIFIDEGQAMEALLKMVKQEDVKMREYVHKLLAAFGEKNFQPSSPNSQLLIEPLSNREIEVLQLIAEGLTNQEIGSKLFLSLNTVKAHTRNIYAKLGINNRTQAVSKARALGILPST